MGAPLSPVQVIAPGLLGALQLKTLGRNPDTVLSDIRPGIELGEWLLTANREYVRGDFTFVAGPNSIVFLPLASLVVPPGESWYVWSASVTFALAVGDVLQGSIGVSVEPQPGFLDLPIVAETITPAITAGAIGNFVVASRDPRRWFASGTPFGILLGDLASAAGTICVVSMEITRLPS